MIETDFRPAVFRGVVIFGTSVATVGPAVRSLRTESRFSHRMKTEEFVHMQLAASVAGLTHKDPTSVLSLHPVFGPWVSLRSVVVLDLDCADLEAPRLVEHPNSACNGAVEARLATLFAPPPAPKPTWRDWLGLRELVGDFKPAREHRFPETMIEYHYAHARDALVRDVHAAAAHLPK